MGLDFVRKLAHKRGLAALGLELELCSVVHLRRRRRRRLGSEEASRRTALMVLVVGYGDFFTSVVLPVIHLLRPVVDVLVWSHLPGSELVPILRVLGRRLLRCVIVNWLLVDLAG